MDLTAGRWLVSGLPQHTVIVLNFMPLTAMERATYTSKSFLIGLALTLKHITVEQAAQAAHVEVNSQIDKWGEVEDCELPNSREWFCLLTADISSSPRRRLPRHSTPARQRCMPTLSAVDYHMFPARLQVWLKILRKYLPYINIDPRGTQVLFVWEPLFIIRVTAEVHRKCVFQYPGHAWNDIAPQSTLH